MRHQRQRAVKRLGRLLRQTVDQIDIDRLKAEAAGGIDQLKDLIGWLDAVNRFLNSRVKVLHAKAQAVKAHAGECVNARHVHRARVNLDRQFGARRQLKMLLQQADQAAMQLEIEVSNAWDEEMQDGDDDAAAQRCLAALRDSYAGMGAVRDSTAEVDS